MLKKDTGGVNPIRVPVTRIVVIVTAIAATAIVIATAIVAAVIARVTRIVEIVPNLC